MVEVMETDGDTNKRKRESQPEDEEVKLLKGAIDPAAFSCHGCTQPLQPPIFQCSKGRSFWCSSCRDNQPKCQFCDEPCSIEPSHGMDRAVDFILVDCRYADHGCQVRTTYYDKERHEKACPRAPCSCPYDSGCGFVGQAPELLDHLTAHHKCPCTEFIYWLGFDLRVKPGLHVLRCKSDDQVILVHTQQVKQPRGYAVSIVCVPPCTKMTGIGCSVSFSCSTNLSGTWTTKDDLRCAVTDCAPTPKDYLCFVPMVSDGPEEEDAGVDLHINIVCAYDAHASDSDDSDYYIQSEEDDSEDSS